MPPRTRTTPQLQSLAELGRAKALEQFMLSANAAEAGAVFTLNGRGLVVDVIHTGAPTLDLALGVGGLPRGRIVEIYGPESAGKTSLALSIAAQAQKAGGLVGVVDAEHALSKDSITQMGVDIDYLALNQPNNGEEGLSMAQKMIESRAFSLVIVDSVAALVPRAEIDGEMGDNHVGLHARMMSQAMRKLAAAANQSNTTVIFINQIREKIGVMFGNPETTTGGRALRFYASVRLEVRSPAGDMIKENGTPIGLGTYAKIVKNKVAPPHKRGEYRLIWGQGIDFERSLLEAGVELGTIIKQGHSFIDATSGQRIAVGKDAAAKALRENAEMREALTHVFYATLRERLVGVPEGAPVVDVPTDPSQVQELAG